MVHCTWYPNVGLVSMEQNTFVYKFGMKPIERTDDVCIYSLFKHKIFKDRHLYSIYDTKMNYYQTDTIYYLNNCARFLFREAFRACIKLKLKHLYTHKPNVWLLWLTRSGVPGRGRQTFIFSISARALLYGSHREIPTARSQGSKDSVSVELNVLCDMYSWNVYMKGWLYKSIIVYFVYTLDRMHVT